MQLRDSVVWVTGASSGIGAATARQLSDQGAKLILSARRKEKLEEVRKACAHPDKVELLPADLAGADFDAVAGEATDFFGRVDGVVHSAGISQRASGMDTSIDVDRRIMEINFFSVVGLTKALLPQMVERGSGNVVVITSMAGHVAAKKRTAYAASKHALHGFFDALRAELHDTGVKVTIVAPGYVNTDISKSAMTGDGESFGVKDDKIANGITPAECGRAVVEAMRKDKREVRIGGREVLGYYIKRLSPGLLAEVVRRYEG